MAPIGYLQLGKSGLTESFITNLENLFKKNKTIKLSVLKSAGHDKKIIKKYSEQILEKLGKKFTARIIGFTIILKKWRKERV
jgi:RNA-binding protein YhbY